MLGEDPRPRRGPGEERAPRPVGAGGREARRAPEPPLALRLKKVARGVVTRLLGPFLTLETVAWMRFVPILPRRLLRRVYPPPWPAPPSPDEIPGALRTTPGSWRDPAAEQAAFEERPLRDFTRLHRQAVAYTLSHGWTFTLPNGPRLARAMRRAAGVSAHQEGLPTPFLSPAEATERVRAEAARLGLNAVGFAPYDEKYAYVEHAPEQERGTAIVCVLEQDYDATQTAPSGRAERAAYAAYGDLITRTAELAKFVQRLGYRAQPQLGPGGQTVLIHYATQAGLGQMGLNGQLLTPAAGSRARLALITTNAKFVEGQPVDYGVHGICDACQACVQRCPVGAIPRKRRPYRGVTKAKIKTERCFPTTAIANGCAICMKVCPVQRYGLRRVLEHFADTGSILGKGTDELEGFDWPLDGRHYGPKEKPPIVSRETLSPPGWHFDASAS